MISKLPLRKRVTLAFLMLGFALSTVFSVAVILITEDYEHVIASEILQGQAEDYALRKANNLSVELPQTQRLSGYDAKDPDVPEALAARPLGVSEDERRDGVHIGVFNTSVGRLVFVIDLSDIERLEQHLNIFLAALILVGTSVAGWLGWLLAGTALKPVRKLADQVDALPVSPVRSQLSADVSEDEVGQLARAIDNYQARLSDADSREKAFFADASHELRTPLSVIQGVVDVMQDDANASPATQSRVQRLSRGVNDMRNLLEAMLSSARLTPLKTEAVPAQTFLKQAGQEALSGKPGIQLRVDADGDIHAARLESRLLMVGLAQKLVQPYIEGILHMQRSATGLSLHFETDPPQAVEAASTPDRSDTGTGSALMDRLASRLGWQITFHTNDRIDIRLD